MRRKLIIREVSTDAAYPEVICRHCSLGFRSGDTQDEGYRIQGQGLPGDSPHIKLVPERVCPCGNGARNWLSQYTWGDCMTQFSPTRHRENLRTVSGKTFLLSERKEGVRGFPSSLSFHAALDAILGCCDVMLWQPSFDHEAMNILKAAEQRDL